MDQESLPAQQPSPTLARAEILMGFVEGLQGSVNLDEKKKLHPHFRQPLTDARRPQINGIRQEATLLLTETLNGVTSARVTILTSNLLGRCYDHPHFTGKAKGGQDGMITQGATAHE